MKNIPNMHLKVYEINTDTYFRKNLKDFSSDINLDGLVANYEKVYDYKNIPSNQKHVETLNLQSDP
jgi:hypothetical protein